MSFNFEEFLKKHYVHPETIAFFMARAAENPKPYYEIGVEEARKTSLEVCTKYGGEIEFIGSETDVSIPSPDVPGLIGLSCEGDGSLIRISPNITELSRIEGIPATVYRPKGCDNKAAPPIVVYFHGGGNTVGSRKTHEAACKAIASEVPCIYVSVEYRLAPESKFPANVDDAKCATEWVAANKASVGGTEDSKLGVSGDSAGGRLAAVVCHEVKNTIDFAVLIYPSVSFVTVYPSITEFGDGPVLSRPVMEWFAAQYAIPESEKTSTRASVILNKDFSYLPPTLLVVADLDPLRDGCFAYYEKLKEAGVKVEITNIKGVPHAFWNLPGAFKENCREAYKTSVTFIRQNCGM